MVWIQYPDKKVRVECKTTLDARESAIKMLIYSKNKRVMFYKSLGDKVQVGFVEREIVGNVLYFKWVSISKKSGVSTHPLYTDGKLQ